METFLNHNDIANLIHILDVINDDYTVIVGPSYGNSNSETRPNKLRVYSYGGHVLDLSTTEANNDLFPDKGYANYYEGLKMGNFTYDELDEETLRSMIKAACNRSKGESTGDSISAKTYKERSVATRLIKKNHVSKYGNGIIIDMEFQSPKEWIHEIATFNGKSTAAKPDFVIYDKETKSFGLVELKYENNSTENLDKHFADFYNIINSENVIRIKEEFCRRMRYLMEYSLIEKIEENDLKEAISKPIWNAFLFVEGDEAKSKQIFENAPIDTRYIRRDEVGYQYVASLEADIDYSYDKFFSV